MAKYPDDFSFEYRWQMGSVPPPYYYEYMIQVKADGTCYIELLPDYPVHHPEKRTATQKINQSTLNYLYEEMTNAGVFETESREVESDWTGGSKSSLVVHASGRDYVIPYSISSADARRIEPVYLAIQELLPSKLLSGLPG